jgi:hypothetical protein
MHIRQLVLRLRTPTTCGLSLPAIRRFALIAIYFGHRISTGHENMIGTKLRMLPQALPGGDGPVGFGRCGVGSDGVTDHKSADQKGSAAG